MASWEEVELDEVRKAFRGRHEVVDEIALWVEQGWRVRRQGHAFGLYPPDPGVRVIPPFVRVDATPTGDATWQAKTTRNKCRALEEQIKNAQS